MMLMWLCCSLHLLTWRSCRIVDLLETCVIHTPERVWHAPRIAGWNCWCFGEDAEADVVLFLPEPYRLWVVAVDAHAASREQLESANSQSVRKLRSDLSACTANSSLAKPTHSTSPETIAEHRQCPHHPQVTRRWGPSIVPVAGGDEVHRSTRNIEKEKKKPQQ